jgi:hypothetical protein
MFLLSYIPAFKMTQAQIYFLHNNSSLIKGAIFDEILMPTRS